MTRLPSGASKLFNREAFREGSRLRFYIHKCRAGVELGTFPSIPMIEEEDCSNLVGATLLSNPECQN